MKNQKTSLVLLACAALAAQMQAFSPYENYLLSGKPRQVGLLAAIKPGREDALALRLAELALPGESEALTMAGIRDLSAFKREIGCRTWVVLHFVQDGGRDYLQAARQFAAASARTAALTELVDPHPLAGHQGPAWLQMEWINYIRGRDVDSPAASRLMIVTTIRPEKEAEYRALHQTVWPGVVDQVARGNNRDLCIFLAEIDGLLVEFLYLEYVGSDQERDAAMDKTDPVNLRWWKQTDACQQGLPGVDGNWVPLVPVK